MEDKKYWLEKLEDFIKKNPNESVYCRGNKPGEVTSDDFKGFRSEPWVVGGAGGGNCWGRVASPISCADPEKNLDLLDKFLLEEMPDITFLQFRMLMKDINYHEYRISEYYGNYYDYKISYIGFDDLASFLSNFEDVPKKKSGCDI